MQRAPSPGVDRVEKSSAREKVKLPADAADALAAELGAKPARVLAGPLPDQKKERERLGVGRPVLTVGLQGDPNMGERR